MGGHRIASAVACSALMAGGCLLGSFGDLQGGDAADASADATSDALIDGGVDAAIGDASASDTFVPDDAAPGARFCSTQIDAAFCDDFDQVDAAPLALWQPPTTTNGSSVTLTNTGLSVPNALLAGVPANASSLLIPANVSHQISGAVSSVRYVYDLLIDFYDTSGSSAYLGAMDERVGLADAELRLILGSTGIQLTASIFPGDGGATTFPPFGSKVVVSSGVWHHIEIDADYSKSPAIASFIFDGATVVDHASITGATFGIGNVTVEAGFLYVSAPTSGWKIRVDNVAVFTQ